MLSGTPIEGCQVGVSGPPQENVDNTELIAPLTLMHFTFRKNGTLK